MGMPPLIETYAVALPAAILNALLLAPTFVVCRRLLRALAAGRSSACRTRSACHSVRRVAPSTAKASPNALTATWPWSTSYPSSVTTAPPPHRRATTSPSPATRAWRSSRCGRNCSARKRSPAASCPLGVGDTGLVPGPGTVGAARGADRRAAGASSCCLATQLGSGRARERSRAKAMLAQALDPDAADAENRRRAVRWLVVAGDHFRGAHGLGDPRPHRSLSGYC